LNTLKLYRKPKFSFRIFKGGILTEIC